MNNRRGFIIPTYTQIENYVKSKFGYSPKPCWVADVKRQMGYNIKIAHNRENENSIKNKCPKNKINDIKEAIKIL